MSTASRSERLSGYALLTVMAIAVVLPFLSIFLASLQPSGTPVVGLTWPERWSWTTTSRRGRWPGSPT